MWRMLFSLVCHNLALWVPQAKRSQLLRGQTCFQPLPVKCCSSHLYLYYLCDFERFILMDFKRTKWWCSSLAAWIVLIKKENLSDLMSAEIAKAWWSRKMKVFVYVWVINRCVSVSISTCYRTCLCICSFFLCAWMRKRRRWQTKEIRK